MALFICFFSGGASKPPLTPELNPDSFDLKGSDEIEEAMNGLENEWFFSIA